MAVGSGWNVPGPGWSGLKRSTLAHVPDLPACRLYTEDFSLQRLQYRLSSSPSDEVHLPEAAKLRGRL
jgi:hypothetical protein